MYLFHFTTKHLPAKTRAAHLVLSLVFFVSVLVIISSSSLSVSIGNFVGNSFSINELFELSWIVSKTYSLFSFSPSRSKKTSGSNENPREKIGSSSAIL